MTTLDVKSSEFVAAFDCGNDLEGILEDRLFLDCLDAAQQSALGFACHQCNVQMVRYLLNRGEDLNAKEKDGMCPIHILCSNSVHTKQTARLAILQMLLQSNVDMDKQDGSGRTALHYACNSNNVTLVDCLTQAGCNIGIRDCDGDTPFTIACRLASENWYFFLNDCLNDQNNIIQPELFPLYLICRSLLKGGADPKQATLLPSAVLFSTLTIVEEFLDLGMDINMMDENRRSPLGCACSSPFIPSSVVSLLLRKGADANENGGGRKDKPIIVAYVHNSVDKIRHLLSYGATISNEEMSEIVSISLSKWFLENPEVIHEDSKELASWKLLLKAGFRPQLDILMNKIKRVTLCNSYTQATPWIYNLLFPMSSLKDLCRVSIRSQLTPSVDEKIVSLPLPNMLKEFLIFL